jgi:hypothetical protein
MSIYLSIMGDRGGGGGGCIYSELYLLVICNYQEGGVGETKKTKQVAHITSFWLVT